MMENTDKHPSSEIVFNHIKFDENNGLFPLINYFVLSSLIFHLKPTMYLQLLPCTIPDRPLLLLTTEPVRRKVL